MAKKAEVIITCDASTVKRVLEGINNEIEKTKRRRQELQEKQRTSIGLTKQEEKELQGLIKYENALNERVPKITGEMKKYGEVMKDLAGSKTKDLKKALREIKAQLENMGGNDANRKKLVSDMKKIQAQIDSNTGALKRQQSAFGALGTTMKNLFAYAGIFAGFNKIKGMIEEVFKANLRLSDSLANIRKVSGLTMKDINQLYGNISKIDTRNTIETLNELAYTGAKLGIAEHGGTQALTGFVKAAEQVQMALGEDLGEEALPALAKLTEVMGLMDRYGVEQAMQKAASSIFQLGATSTATGKNIVEFSKRLMGLANVSRISADELLAIGSAADAMGLMPEVAATAFNKLFTAVQQKHNLIEKTLDLPKGRINYWFEQGKTMNAIVEIFDAMNKRGNMNALDGVFKDLGSDGARLVAVMTTMADRVDILKKHLETSTKAFKEGEAVIGEYMIQNETAQALMERASNLWAKAFTNPEGVTMVQTLAKEWYNLSKEMTSNQATMLSLKATIEAVALALRTVIALAPFLIKAFAWAGVLSIIRGVGFGIAGLIAQLRAATGAAMTLQVVLKSNWVLAGVSAVAAAMTMLYEKSQAAAQAAELARERQAELDKQLAQSKETIDSVARPLERYKQSLDKANVSEAERNRLLKEYLAGNYQDYLDYLGIEIDKTLDLAKAYNMVVKTMKQKKAYEERESYRDTVNGQNRMDRIAAGMEFEREAKRVGLEGVDRQWIAKNQRGTTMDIYMQLMRQRYGNDVKMFNWDNLKDVTQVYRGRKTRLGPTKLYGDALGDVDLWNAIANYQKAYRTERNTNIDVDDMFKDMVGDYDPDQWEKSILEAQLKRKGGLSKEKPDKDALKAAKKAAQDAKAAARKELKDAETETNAIIAKVEEWYTLQQSAVTEAYNEGKITEKEMTLINRQMEAGKNQALAAARRSLSGQDTATWNTFKAQMGALMVDQSEWSKELLDAIQNTNMDALRNALMKFDGKKSLEQWGFTSTAFRDGLNKNAAKNEAKVNELTAKAREELNKLLLKYEYFDQAARTFANNLVQIGAIGTTAEQMAKGMNGVPDANQTMDAVRGLLTSVIQSGNGIYAINPGDAQAVADMLRSVTTEAMTEADSLAGKTSGTEARWLDLFPALKDWMENPEQHRKELEDVFNIMLIAEQDYYKKRKESFQHQKTQLTERFQAAGYTDQEERTDKQLSSAATQQQNGMGTFWQQNDLGSIANDPEILAIQNRIYWRNQEVQAAQASLDAMKARHQQVLDDLRAKQEAELAAREESNATEAELDQLRLEHKQQMAEAERQLDVERMGAEDLLNDRQTALTEQMEALTSKTVQEMQKRIQAVNNLTKPFATAAGNIGKKFGEMIAGVEEESMTWNEIWKNMLLAVAESVLNMGAQYAQNLIMQKAMNKGLEAEEIAHAGVMVPAGIAAGSAKTIGALGWLGIALIPVITSLLMGLLQGALSSSRSGSESKTSSSAAKTKLVSGMLTYDKGNVQTILGSDGRVYRAREEQELQTGIVTQPITAPVNGQQALVGERGPEIVIGRQTTQAIMMNEPELLQHLIDLDQGRRSLPYRAMDSGNLPAVAATVADGATATDASATGNADLRASIDRQNALMEQVLHYLQNPVPPEINMYGDNGLRRKLRQADRLMSRYE